MGEVHDAEIAGSSSADAMDWDDFRVFLEVVRYGSFNRAAVKLNMTQPTVSRRLMRLEKAIGMRLFERDRRGPRLTQEGQRIYNDANAAQAALNRAVSRKSHRTERMDGDCKLFMSDGLASYWVTRFLAPFFQRYPDIELKLFGAHDSSVDKRAVFDLHVHYYEPADSDQIATHVATMHFIPFGSREYLRAHGTPRSIEDLSGHRLLDLAIYLADVGSWTRWSRDGSSTNTALYTNLSACLSEAVRNGVGIALLPTYAPLVDDALVPLEIGMHFQAPIFIGYRRDAAGRWPVRMTLDYLRDHVFDRENMPWFADSYAPPASDWAERCAALVKQSAGTAAGGGPHLAKKSGGKP